MQQRIGLMSRICAMTSAFGVFLVAVGSAISAEPDVAPAPAAPAEPSVELKEILVQPPEPKYVAPTHRDRIGRIWAPVLIDGKGPYRLVLDTGANHSAITAHTAESLGIPATAEASTEVTGFTGSAVVPTIHVNSVDIGDL